MNKDITVVLTLYKRPYNLRKQLEYIKRQTIKPAEILLFKDKPNDGSNIEIPQDIISEFDNIEIAEQNIGVWGRFKYAQSAKSEYVCIFDDDTFPGSKWLENCLTQMKIKEGLYGTNGVIMKVPEDYPKVASYQNIGWLTSNEQSQQVDFVGHSWFLKKSWLAFMFNDTQDIQALKYAGEDITLSFKLQEQGINTYVPPHPYNDKRYWGAIPELSKETSIDANALSGVNANLNKYNQGMLLVLSKGFKPLITKQPERIAKLTYQILLIKRLTWFIHFISLKDSIRRYLFYKFMNI